MISLVSKRFPLFSAFRDFGAETINEFYLFFFFVREYDDNLLPKLFLGYVRPNRAAISIFLIPRIIYSYFLFVVSDSAEMYQIITNRRASASLFNIFNTRLIVRTTPRSRIPTFRSRFITFFSAARRYYFYNNY